jgi:hypothetical protein
MNGALRHSTIDPSHTETRPNRHRPTPLSQPDQHPHPPSPRLGEGPGVRAEGDNRAPPHHPLPVEGKVGYLSRAPSSPSRGDSSSVAFCALGEAGVGG